MKSKTILPEDIREEVQDICKGNFYTNLTFKALIVAENEIEEKNQETSKLLLEICSHKGYITDLRFTIDQKDLENQELKAEIERLKNPPASIARISGKSDLIKYCLHNWELTSTGMYCVKCGKRENII